MKKLLLLLLFQAIITTTASATCFIFYVYDAAGNRILRYYDCPDTDPGDYDPDDHPNDPTAKFSQSTTDTSSAGSDEAVELIANLAPNPTKTVSVITFSKELTDGIILITDGKGAVIKKDRINGRTYSIDLSTYASGTYFISIRVFKRNLSFKLDKL